MAGSSELVNTNLKDALKMLEDVCVILEEADIPYNLDAGTLLGIVRENRLLPWDTDLDIAIPSNYGERLIELRKKINRAGYLTRLRYSRITCGPVPAKSFRLMRVYTRRFFFFKKEKLMDLFIKYKDGDSYYWVVRSDEPILQSCAAKHLDERMKKEFNGREYFIPKDYDGYLTRHYGDWRTPKKDYSFHTECGCNIQYFSKDDK